jgi:hypothetical protein
MRLEFSLTVEDFREANEANLVAAARPRTSLQAVVLIWYFAAIVIETVLVWRFDPWAPNREWLSDIINSVVTPIVPWLILLAYAVWYSFQSVHIAASAVKPWEIQSAAEAKPVRRRPGMKVFRSGLITFAGGIAAMVFTINKHRKGTMEGADSFVYAYGMASVPWGIYSLFAAILTLGLTRRKIDASWEQQTQLHCPITMQFSEKGVIHETLLSRTEFGWTYFVGSRETPGLFLLYASPLLFYMVTKRALSSQADVSLLRNTIKECVGARQLGFPVLPPAAINAPGPEMTEVTQNGISTVQAPSNSARLPE